MKKITYIVKTSVYNSKKGEFLAKRIGLSPKTFLLLLLEANEFTLLNY